MAFDSFLNKLIQDKRFDELRDIIKKARNTRKNNDLNASLNLFQDFSKGTKLNTIRVC